MSKEIGLWIDHRKAVIVTIENGIASTQEIISNMEKHVRFSGTASSKDSTRPSGSTSEDVRDRQFGDHLEKYYDEVISIIRDADTILAFGPGEAKGELENRIELKIKEKRNVITETMDKMTNPQIEAKVREYYLKK